MRSVRERIDAFMGDEKTRAQYDALVAKGQALQEKQQTQPHLPAKRSRTSSSIATRY